VDGVRFDLLGPEVTPVIWGFGSVGRAARRWSPARRRSRRWSSLRSAH